MKFVAGLSCKGWRSLEEIMILFFNMVLYFLAVLSWYPAATRGFFHGFSPVFITVQLLLVLLCFIQGMGTGLEATHLVMGAVYARILGKSCNGELRTTMRCWISNAPVSSAPLKGPRMESEWSSNESMVLAVH